MMDDYKETRFPRHNREVAQISPRGVTACTRHVQDQPIENPSMQRGSSITFWW